MCGVVMVLLCSGAAPAGAQPPAGGSGAEGAEGPTQEELAAARKLFEDGLTLERDGAWREALAKFEKVGRVKMTPQVRFHIAHCNEHLGHLVEAVNGFELAAQEARTVGKSAAKVAANAPERAAALRERLAHVRISVTGVVRTSRVLLDGKPISEALFDTDIPVNPGPHAVQVEDADGKIVFNRDFELETQGAEAVQLEIHDPEPKPDLKPPPPPPPPPPEEEDSIEDRWPAFLVGGVGVLALVGGGVCWGLRDSTISNIRDTCNKSDRYCDPDMEGTAQLGEDYTLAGRILFPVGGTALAAGVLMFFLFDSDGEDAADEAPPEGDVTVTVLPSMNGVHLIGTF